MIRASIRLVTGESREEIGPYIVYEQLGSGGMATVHRAEQRGIAGFRRVVALKRLHANVAADPDLLKSFIHEARLASYLKHTNVAQTFDLGKVGDTYFIAMEFVPGPTLGQLMKQCAAAAGPIPLGIVLSIMAQVCDALDHAHNLCDDAGKPLGIIHRDVSPSNVIVSNSGTVKLIDFGIAKAANSDVRTQTGMIKGKFGYIAPEYLTGQLDPRGDLFGAGVIAHELLAGRPLFLGRNDFDTLSRIREMPILPPSRWNPQVPPDLDDIVLTALERDPDRRWQSAAAFRNALHSAQRSCGIVTGQQIYEWVEWAFSQVPGGASASPRRAPDGGDDPSMLIEVQGQGGRAGWGEGGRAAGSPGAWGEGGRAASPSDPGWSEPALAPVPQTSAPESLSPSEFSVPARPRRRSSHHAAPLPAEIPPETTPAELPAGARSRRRSSHHAASLPEALAPETLPPSAFAPEPLPASAFAGLPPGPPPGPPVDPAVKLAAAMLAPAPAAPVSAPKLVSAPQAPTRSKPASIPPVMVARDKPASVPPPLPGRDKPSSIPPVVPGAARSPSLPPERSKSASVPPPLPPGTSKPPPGPPGALAPSVPLRAPPAARTLEQLAGLSSPQWSVTPPGMPPVSEAGAPRRSSAAMREGVGRDSLGPGALGGAAMVPPSSARPIPPSGGQPVPPSGGQPVPPSGGQPVPASGGQPVPPSGGQPMPPSGARAPVAADPAGDPLALSSKTTRKAARKAAKKAARPASDAEGPDPRGRRRVALLLLLAALSAAAVAYYIGFNL